MLVTHQLMFNGVHFTVRFIHFLYKYFINGKSCQ